MKIAHLSDIHFFCRELSLQTLFSKKILGTLNHYFNPKRKSIEFDVFHLPAFLKAQGVSHVIISGDFTTTSNVEEYQKASAFVGELKRCGFKVLAIPGNHDVYTKGSESSQRFYEYISTSKDLRDKKIALEDLGEGYKCILLDTTLATPLWSSQGLFSKELEKRLEVMLEKLPKNEPIIVVNHFPVFRGNRPKRHQMLRLEALRGLLEHHKNIFLYLHGHTHKSEIMETQPTMVNCGSLTLTHGGSFHIMDLSPDFLEIEAYTYHENQWTLRMKKIFPMEKVERTFS